jgi:endonuclease III
MQRGQAIGTRSERGAARQLALALAPATRFARLGLHGQHGPGPVVNQVDASGWITQVLGQGGVLVGLLAAGDQVRQSGLLGTVKAVQYQQIHGRTLTRCAARTRYLGPVGRPRTPKGRARVVSTRLAEEYPGTAAELCALDFDTPFQLLAATILSAQSTDTRVNLVTPALFAAYPDAAALARADPEHVEELVRTTGFFRAKTRSLIGMAQAVEVRFGGVVPTELSDLVTLPGVGRKTGNVLRSVAFGLPGLPVDTHVLRLSGRLGLTPTELKDPVKVEHELDALLPPAEWGSFSLRLILHGRAICQARKPACGRCLLADICPSAGTFGG